MGPDCTALRCVALTFDGGPNGNTARVLDILASYHAHATFFVIGKKVADGPALVARMAAEGHEIGNHGFSHTPFPRLSAAQIEAELTATNAAIAAAANGYTPHIFRPPYGSTSPRVEALLPYVPVLWNIDTHDWEAQNRSEIIRSASRARAGNIVLMHSFLGRTVGALPAILQSLTDKGFTFVTVSDLQSHQP
jgi:peptidoglycan/xylan/chitin deacetylase (PgdA/CDA1 family)